jgi:hypothetical protein
VIERTRATGVEYARGREVVRAHAAGEVIVSAGAFNTPQILMLSGIGPAAHLRAIGITPVIDLAVGKNLQDHVAALIMYSRPVAGSFREADAVRPHGDGAWCGRISAARVRPRLCPAVCTPSSRRGPSSPCRISSSCSEARPRMRIYGFRW